MRNVSFAGRSGRRTFSEVSTVWLMNAYDAKLPELSQTRRAFQVGLVQEANM